MEFSRALSPTKALLAAGSDEWNLNLRVNELGLQSEELSFRGRHAEVRGSRTRRGQSEVKQLGARSRAGRHGDADVTQNRILSLRLLSDRGKLLFQFQFIFQANPPPCHQK